MRKLIPYEGKEPYIFISYAHRNSEQVMPIIERLMADGYRVWYDEGIVPGTEWDEYIADHIKDCGCVVSMISKEYMQSDNCKDELKYARDKDKSQVLIYLSEAELTEGLQMRLNRLQAVYKYAYGEDEEAFYKKLYESELLECCRGKAGENIGGLTHVRGKSRRGDENVDLRSKEFQNKRAVVQKIGIISGIAILLAILGILFIPKLLNGHKHEIVVTPGVEATCTETGLTAGETCSTCNAIIKYQQLVPAKGHKYGANELCEVCGKASVNHIHDRVEIPEIEATCAKTGLTAGEKCSVCGDILVAQTVIRELGHIQKILPKVEPTCTETGLTEGSECDRCGDVLKKQDTLKERGHNELAHVAQAATCTAIGWDAYVECTRCDYTTYAEIKELGHSYADDNVCEHCGGLTSASVGLKFSSNYDGTCRLTGIGVCQDTDIVVPAIHDGERVIEISDNAFYYNSNITSITIPENVTIIGNKAFYGCTALEKVSIVKGVTTIGSEVFYGCTNLKKIYIPDGITSIGESAFYNCKKLELNEKDGVNYIGNLATPYIVAFSSSANIVSVSFPDSVKFIWESAFYNCKYLENAVISDETLGIGKSAFYGCNNLMNVSFGDDCKLKSIGNSAFSYCQRLTSIKIGKRVESIGIQAFSYCYSLESIVVSPKNTVFHSDGNCCINTWGKQLVFGCQNSVIPTDGSVTSILQRAFQGCTKLKSVSIPDSITSIGDAVFRGCTGLESVTFGANIKLMSIPMDAFWGCDSLKGIMIPDSVTEIRHNAFSSCYNLTELKFGENSKLMQILQGAFSDCISLTEINLPKNLIALYYHPFSGCYNVEKITVAAGNTTFRASGNCLIGNDGAVLFGCQNSVIPTDGSVKIIGEQAFYKCIYLTSIVIPDSVTQIANSAFSNCENLVSVTLSKNLKIISQSAFSSCSKLKEIVLPNGLEEIDARVFSGSGLTSINIPSSVKSIGISAFASTQIKSVVIPEGVEYINQYAFQFCKSLESVTIPKSVKKIEMYAFNQTALTEVKYNGTVAEWNAMSKDSLWASGSGNYIIHCTNGEIEKS